MFLLVLAGHTLAQTPVSGTYQVKAQLAPFCLNGTFPVAVQTATGAKAGTATLAIGLKGEVSGQLFVDGATLTVTGKSKFTSTGGKLTAVASNGSNTLTLKGELSGNTFAGTAKSQGTVAAGATTFTLDLSGAPPLIMTVTFTLNFDATGKATGTGNAVGCGLNIPVTTTAKVKGTDVTVKVLGIGIKMTGKGSTGINGFDLTFKVSGAGAKAVVTASASTFFLVGLAISPTNATLSIAGTIQYTATGQYSDTTTSNLTGVATFTSSDSNIVTITTGGLATGVATGTVTISANVDGFSANTSLRVIDLIAQARAKLEDGDPHGADDLFRQVLAFEPGNKDANFGVTLTSLLFLVEDPGVTNLIVRLGQQPLTSADVFEIVAGTKTLSNFFGAVPPFPLPQVSEVQVVLTDNILPKLAGAVTLLRNVEGMDFTFEITPAMIDRASVSNSVFLDDGDFFTLDAALTSLEAGLQTACAYHLDFDESTVLVDPLGVLSSPEFFTLKTDGAARLQSALALLGQSAASLEAGYAFLRSNDVDTATDGGLRLSLHDYNHDGVIDDGDVVARDESVSYIFGLVNDSLLRMTNICFAPTSNVCIQVNASRLFLAPLDRNDLPPLTYDLPRDPVLSELLGRPIACRVPNEDTDGDGDPVGDADDTFVHCVVQATGPVPDPTFHGLLPDGLFSLTNAPRDGLLLFSSAVCSTNVTGRRYAVAPALDGVNLMAVHDFFSEIQFIDPVTGEFASDPLETEMSGIGGVTTHQGDIWATGYFVDSSNAVFIVGIFHLDTDGLVLEAFDAGTEQFITSDGTTLWVSSSGGGDNQTMVRSFDPAGPTLSDPIFNTDDPQFAGRAFAGKKILALTAVGANLVVNCDGIIVELATDGTVVSERKPLQQAPDAMTFFGGKLLFVGEFRLDSFEP